MKVYELLEKPEAHQMSNQIDAIINKINEFEELT